MAAKEFSFDIVSKVDLQEVRNAVDQAQRELSQRFDFKGSKSSIELSEKEPAITLVSDDEFKLRNVLDILQSKLARRGIDLKVLQEGKVEPAAGGTVRQVLTLQQGIPQDLAKRIAQLIRDAKIKVQPQILGDQLRVSGKVKDDLQAAIQLVKSADLPIPLQFVNYR